MYKALQISLFGVAAITLHGESIIPPVTGKPLALLSYLAVTRAVHSRAALATLLWDDLDDHAARNNLRYLLPDLRRALGDYLLITPRTVAFDLTQSTWCDVTAVRQTLALPADTVTTADLQATLDLYQGEFLAGFRVRNAPYFEAWVSSQQAELHGLVIHGFSRLATRYVQAADFAAGFATTGRLLALAPWHEEGQRLQMQLLALTGQRSQALEQYQQLITILHDELDVAPAAETTALFAAIRTGHFPPPAHAPVVAPPLPASAPPQLPPLPAVARPATPIEQGDLPPALPTPAPALPPTLPLLGKGNLSHQLTPLIGRQLEISTLLAKVLDPAYGLLSIVGAGGMGKTRLALAVADAARPHFVDGAWFVALAPLTYTVDLHQQLAAAIGEALDLSFAGAEPLPTQLFAQLRYKKLLLVLDNFEQLLRPIDPSPTDPSLTDPSPTNGVETTGRGTPLLVDAAQVEAADGATFLVQLLQSAPGLTLIVTSRHYLALQAESPWLLDGLSFPTLDEAQGQSERKLLTYESLALFVERARRARPNFQFDTENRTAVIQICQLLEGVPLAIELAASLVRTQSCAAIAAALTQNYQILATTLRDLSPAHRTMQSVLDYSWVLLAAAEQRLLARIAVFRGGFTADAATVITGAQPTQLTSLVHHSLLQVVRDGAGQERYLVHEVVRQYGAEQLARAKTETQQIHAQHCAYYAALLGRERMEITRHALARRRIQADLDNVRAAWDWAVTHYNIAALEQSLDTLTAFYEFIGFFAEAVRVFGNAINQVQQLLQGQPAVPPELALLLGRLLAERAGFSLHLAQPTEAIRYARTVIELGESTGNRYLQADGQRRLGGALINLDDYGAAHLALAEGLAIARAEGFHRIMALCLHNLAMLFYNQGEYARSIDYTKEAVLLTQQIQDSLVEAPLTHNLGIAYLVQGDFAAALDYLTQNLQTSRQLGWQRLFAYACMNMGYLLTYVGAYTQAQHYLEEALPVFRNLASRAEESSVLSQLSIIYRVQGDLAQAYQLALHALQIAEADGVVWQQGIALIELGDTLVAMGRISEALPIYVTSVDLWAQLGNTSQVILAQAALAAAHFGLTHIDVAHTLVEKLLPGLADVSVEGARVFWVCYQVLSANHDARCMAVLQRGYHFLQTQLQTIKEPTLRDSFLGEVTVNRALWRAAAA